MNTVRATCTAILLVCLSAGSAVAGSVGMKISGPGAVNDSTIKAGEKVSVDIYVKNDSTFTGFSLGFRILSPDIKKVNHVVDSGNGLNEQGDVKGHNGWEDMSIWDFGGVFVVDTAWNGVLPDTLGFGGLSVKKQYRPHENQKVLSFDMIVPTPGVLTIDSCFFPPGGRWLFSSAPPGPAEEPDWLGPYTFTVVK